jgi:hypothetical protein
MKPNNPNIIHNKYAPYWAGALFIFWAVGLSTIWIDLGAFWKGYVLDMVGPAWNYILFRGLFTAKADNIWTRFFTADRTFTIILLTSILIETAQYYHLYDAVYDKWDFIAYISILLPLFLLDKRQNSKKNEEL